MTVSGPGDGPDPRTPTESLNDALLAFTMSVGEALDDVCSYGLIIGEAYVPFDPDDEDGCDDIPEDEVICTQAWVRVSSVGVVDLGTGFDGGESCASTLSLDIEVGVVRCIPIEEDGAAPKAMDMLVSATQSMADMRAIYCAAMSADLWESITSNQWVPMGPRGGQYGGMWTFTVEVA